MKRICFTLIFNCVLILTAQGIDDSLYPFDFKMDHMSIAERATLFAELGYSGTTFAVKTDKQRDKFKEYLETDEFKNGKLTIPVVYFPFDFSGDNVEENTLWKKTLNFIPKETALWLIILQENATEPKVLELIRNMSEEAHRLGKEIVIYPHDNTFIESVEDALPYIEKLKRPNLFLTMHLCHELRDGNGDRLLEVAIKAAPYLKFVSISGSNRTMMGNYDANWSDAIKPLDQGDYDISRFVSVLQKIKFKGKTMLHTFGIEDEPKDHLSRSMAKWKEMVASTYDIQNNDLNQILDTPENAYWDENSKSWFISNLGGEKVTLEKDGYGWITRLNEEGKVISNRWIEGLDAPTGMASYKNYLYVGDRGVLVQIDIENGKIIKRIPLPGSQFVNDVAANINGEIFISDTFTDRIYKLNLNGVIEVFVESRDLEYPNGLWVDGNDLIVATWGPMTNRATFETSRLGTLKKVNLKSKKISSVGGGHPIANFDGIVKYGNYFYATDWTGGRLLKISEKGNVEVVLSGFVQMADLGINKEKGIIMIPEMSKNRFIMLHLDKL